MNASSHALWATDQEVSITIVTYLHMDPDQRAVAAAATITEKCNQQPHLQKLGGPKVQQLIKNKSH